MASTGNVFPTVGANVDRASSTAWTSPENVVSDNTTDATVVVPSDYLVTSGYGFTIPADAVIRGVTVRVEASETGTGTSNYIPRLHSDTTPTLIGAAKGAVTVSGATKVISTTGGVSDLWGATLTPAIVNDAGFGVSIWSTDTTNTLAVDFVTIAIEYTTVAPLTPPRIGFVRRRNTTNRRLRVADLPESAAPAPPASSSRAMDAAFTTRRIASRRLKSVGWLAALAAYSQVPVVPVAAWLVSPGPRRRTTEYRSVAPQPLYWPYIAPTIQAATHRPNVKVVRFNQKIRLPLPQVLYPPATGPPILNYGDSAAFRVRVVKGKRLVPALVAPVFPATPLATVIPASTDRLKAIKRRGTTYKAQRPASNPLYLVTPVIPATIDRKAALKRRATEFSRQHLPELNVYPSAPTAAVIPASTDRLTVLRRRITAFTAQIPLRLEIHPATPGGENTSRALEPAFITRTTRSRRLLRVPPVPTDNAVPPETSEAPEPAFRLIRANRVEQLRRLILPQPQLLFPSTPAPPAANQIATLLLQPKRRKSRQGLFLSSGAAPDSRVTAQYPSYVRPKAIKRDGLSRRLLKLPTAPSASVAAPAQAPYPAYAARKAIKRKETERKLRQAPSNPRYPLATVSGSIIGALKPHVLKKRKGRNVGFVATGATFGQVTTPEAPTSTDYTARAPFTIRAIKGKRLVKGLVAPVFPPPPPPPPVAFGATVLLKPNRRKSRQGLFLTPIAAPDRYTVPQPQAAWRLAKANRTAFERRLLVPAHNPSYPQTPVVAQPYAASLLVKTHRIEQVRKLIPQFILLEYPPTPVVIVEPPHGGDDKPDSKHKHPGWDKKRALLKLSKEQELANDIRRIYRELTAAPELQQRAEEVIFSAAQEPVQLPIEPDRRAELARQILAEIAAQLAVEQEIALRLLYQELLAQQQEADDMEAIGIILGLV